MKTMIQDRKTKAIGLFLIGLLILSCATVPVTGRRQLNLIPDSQLNSMSFSQYSEFISSHKLSKDKEKTAMVKRVGKRIEGAVERYFASHNMSNQLKDYRWEFNLVEDSLVNAWCMPGGKVVVYTGILPVTKNEAGLAVVMGHEIAHAVANHGNERMSQGLIALTGGLALSKALENKKQETQNLFLAAYGVGVQLGALLPYSRLHESEADRLGLIFMAMAGYDPHEAVDFWRRMAADKKGGAPPEFLSTHPSDETRIRKIQEAIPEAMQYYKGGK
jgi:predicted Zn-dependent protease